MFSTIFSTTLLTLTATVSADPDQQKRMPRVIATTYISFFDDQKSRTYLIIRSAEELARATDLPQKQALDELASQLGVQTIDFTKQMVVSIDYARGDGGSADKIELVGPEIKNNQLIIKWRYIPSDKFSLNLLYRHWTIITLIEKSDIDVSFEPSLPKSKLLAPQPKDRKTEPKP